MKNGIKKNAVKSVALPVESKPLYTGWEAVWRKLGFASGEITYNLPWMLVSSFLMFFLTDIAFVPAAIVGALFLGVRVFDAVNDPIIGILADKTRTRHGRYRPWLLVSGPLLVLTVILLFWAHPEWSESARVWYAIILYVLAVIAATAWNIPFGGLHATLTPDPTERASFASYRILISSAACAVSAGVFLTLVNRFGGAEGNNVQGYLMATTVICFASAPFIFTAFFSTKEVVQPPKNQKINVSSLWNVVAKNPPLLIVIIGFFVFGFMSYGRMTVAMYYFSYYWNDISLFSVFVLFNGLITGVMAFFGVHLLTIFKSKRNTILFGYLGMMITSFIVYVLNPVNSSGLTALIVLLVSGLFNGICTCMLYSMIPDTVEYGQWKSGIRTDGFVYSGTSFMLKFGGAIAPALLGVLLASSGYAPGVQQGASSLSIMNGMMNLMPALMSLIALVAFVFYKLDNTLHAKIVGEIADRGQELDS